MHCRALNINNLDIKLRLGEKKIFHFGDDLGYFHKIFQEIQEKYSSSYLAQQHKQPKNVSKN